jgi:biotin operon repressor
MKASRLLSLLLLLQTRHRVRTSELAERLEVSRRTVLRDVEELSAAGVPVYAERGRHGGIVLLPGARLDASHLEPGEMDALSVAGLDANQRDQLGLAAAHETATRKIAARQAPSPSGAFPESLRLAHLIVVDNTAWLADPVAAGTSLPTVTAPAASSPSNGLRLTRASPSRHGYEPGRRLALSGPS